MNVRTGGRAALIIAAGLWMWGSVPLHAAPADSQAAPEATAVGSATDTSAEPAKPARRHSRRAAARSHKVERHAAKPASVSPDEAANADQPAGGAAPAAMPASVTDANAQWPATPTTPVAAAPAPAASTPADSNNVASTDSSFPAPAAAQLEQPATAAPDSGASSAKVVAADQLNDVDRAISDDKPPLTLAQATIDTPAPDVTADTSNHSQWDRTSLIGKIFVAFGGLLTMASAARMFMA